MARAASLLLFGCPALGRGVVRGLGVHPLFGPRAVLLLPEGRAGLEVVHDELAGGERLTSMGGCDHYQHDLLGGPKLAEAMDHRDIDHAPALRRLVRDLRDLALRHSGVVLERHGHISYQPDEARDRADASVPGEPADLRAGIEILPLDRDPHPPVTGGKNATSSPAWMLAEGCTMSWFTAARTSALPPNALP